MSASSSQARSADDAGFCANLVRERDFARYAATLFSPQERRRALLALFAFNVEIAHVRDHVSQPLPGEIRLQWWSDLIDGHDHGDATGNPVAAELMRTVTEHDLPRDILRKLVEARVFDVYDDPMLATAELEGYCRDTSSALFALSARILGGDGEKCEQAARHAGVAQGIADVVALLPIHAARRQLYLPRDLLDKHGAAEADVFAGRMTPQLGEVVASLRAEALSSLDAADDLLAGVLRTARTAFLPLALVRRALRQQTENVFEPSQSSHLAMLWTLWRASRSRPFQV